MKVVLTDGPRSGTLTRIAEVVIHTPPARLRNPSFGGEDRILGERSASGFPLPKEPLRGRSRVHFCSRAAGTLEGDLNASVGTVRDEIEDGAVLPIVVSKCAIGRR
jgi:hypothetical protein